jgi:hypothetical protein
VNRLEGAQIAHGRAEWTREAAMAINGRDGMVMGVAFSLLLGAAGAAADDPFDKQKEAAEQRYEMAKESCERLDGDDQDRCEEKAKADYTREMEAIRQGQTPGSGDMDAPGSGTDGMGTDEEME